MKLWLAFGIPSGHLTYIVSKRRFLRMIWNDAKYHQVTRKAGKSERQIRHLYDYPLTPSHRMTPTPHPQVIRTSFTFASLMCTDIWQINWISSTFASRICDSFFLGENKISLIKLEKSEKLRKGDDTDLRAILPAILLAILPAILRGRGHLYFLAFVCVCV